MTARDRLIQIVWQWVPERNRRAVQERIDAALAEVAKEQMEADCQEMCGRCFEGELVRLRQGDFGHWTHLDGRICEADSIRRAFAERKKNGKEAEGSGEAQPNP